MLFKLIIKTILVLISLASLRLLYILPRFRPHPKPRKRGTKTHLLIVLGSGGHTAEMMYMLDNAVFGPPSAPSSSTSSSSPSSSPKAKRLNWADYSHRTWIVSSGDSVSAVRVAQFEQRVREAGLGGNGGSFEVVTVPRARRIYQPLWTSPFTCLQCGWACANVLLGGKAGFPDLIVTNGPATATVLIFTAVLLRFFNVRGCNSTDKMRTIYVESWARVKRMSLSGRLLCWVADRVLVQWEQLRGAGGRAEYHGVLCF